MIPRVFHFVWVGPRPIPLTGLKHLRIWQALHPGWETRLWTDRNVGDLPLSPLYHLDRNPGHRSDLVRYALLQQHGGVYLDLDYRPQRNIEPLLRPVGAYLSSCKSDADGGFWPVNSFLAAPPQHPFFSFAAARLPDWFAAHRNADPSIRTGPAFLGTLAREWKLRPHTSDTDLTILAPHYLDPFNYQEKTWGQRRRWPHAYAVHELWGSWSPGSEKEPLA